MYQPYPALLCLGVAALGRPANQGARDGPRRSPIFNAPLDAAFVAIISAVAVAIGLGVHLRRTEGDRGVFDIR